MFRIVMVSILIVMASSGAQASCRSATVKHHFDVQQGFPHGRKGYVVDHRCALQQGGLDITANMQYQTIAEGHKKDRIELTPQGRALYCDDTNSLSVRTVFNCKGEQHD